MPPSILACGRSPAVFFHRLSLLPVLALLCACAGLRESSNPYAGSQPVSLTVENNNWADVVVSVRCGSMRKRLGTVSTNTRVVFTIPGHFRAAGGDVCFEADPIGSTGVYSSPEVLLVGGETFTWTIEEYLPLSTLVVH